MIEDDQTVEEMRSRGRLKTEPRTFMSASEMRTTRLTVLRVTQSKLAEQLIKPTTGSPVTPGMISYWEFGRRPIPLWAARRVRDLAEAARRYDARKGV